MTPTPSTRVSIDASAVPANPAGAGRYVLDLVAALRRQPDVDLTVICRRGDELRWDDGAHRALAVAPELRPVRLAWEQARLPGVLGQLPLDVHHSPHYTMPERARLPRVVTVHDLTFLENPSWHEPAKVAYFRRAIRTAAMRADAIVAVSEATAARLEALLHPKAPVHVIAHGVDTSRYRPVGPDDDSQVLGITDPYVLFIGTIEPRKDIPTLVRAFDKVAASQPELSLVIAGAPGWGTEAVDDAVAKATHGNRVRLLGYISEDDKTALLKGAAAVAYPSLEEGFGLPALEALACGAPLVTTSGTAMEEVVGNAALLIAPGDTGALTGALEALIRRGPEVGERCRLGLQVAARYTWDASAAAHVAVYRSVV